MKNTQSFEKEIRQILEWGKHKIGIKITVTEKEMERDTLEWVYKLFPKNAHDEELYLKNGPVDEIMTKYVMYHCLMEIWCVYNKTMESHRSYVFNKVMYGKAQGWEECESASEEYLSVNVPLRNIDYYLRFDKKMFDCVGI